MAVIWYGVFLEQVNPHLSEDINCCKVACVTVARNGHAVMPYRQNPGHYSDPEKLAHRAQLVSKHKIVGIQLF